jgi:hypothetical protein
MLKPVLLFLFGVCVLRGQDQSLVREPVPQGRTLWRVSMLSLAAASAADMHSSWGKRELNPILRDSAGTFGGQGALIKLALQGGLAGAEYLLTRRHPGSKTFRLLTVVNFGAATGLGAVAARNYQMSGRIDTGR